MITREDFLEHGFKPMYNKPFKTSFLKKRFGIYVNNRNNVVVGNNEPLFRTIDKIKIKKAIKGE